MKNNKEKRLARKKQTAEDFTPLTLVNEILDRLSKESNNEVWTEDKTFVDPACGNGNFLIEVLKRKLNLNHDPMKAIATIFGADIMKDNIQECRLRLLKTLIEYTKKNNLPKPDSIKIVQTIYSNIKWVDMKKYPNGSLDYDFSFKNKLSEDNAKKAIGKIKNQLLMDLVEIA